MLSMLMNVKTDQSMQQGQDSQHNSISYFCLRPEFGLADKWNPFDQDFKTNKPAKVALKPWAKGHTDWVIGPKLLS